jgi:hypothetical protein
MKGTSGGKSGTTVPLSRATRAITSSWSSGGSWRNSCKKISTWSSLTAANRIRPRRRASLSAASEASVATIGAVTPRLRCAPQPTPRQHVPSHQPAVVLSSPLSQTSSAHSDSRLTPAVRIGGLLPGPRQLSIVWFARWRAERDPVPRPGAPAVTWSGRGDLNPRPQRPERCALTKLRYFPAAVMLPEAGATRTGATTIGFGLYDSS